MDGFALRRARKEQQIISAATRLFMTYGVKKVTMTEVAREAHVSQVTIYNYFKNKHNLVHEVVLSCVDESMQAFVDIVYSEQKFPDKIKQLMAYKAEYAQKMNEEFYHHIMKEYAVDGGELQKIIQEKVLGHWRVLLTEGRKNGYIDLSISDEAIFFYFEMLRDCMSKKEVYEKVLPFTEDFTKLLFYGLLGSRGKDGDKQS